MTRCYYVQTHASMLTASRLMKVCLLRESIDSSRYVYDIYTHDGVLIRRLDSGRCAYGVQTHDSILTVFYDHGEGVKIWFYIFSRALTVYICMFYVNI